MVLQREPLAARLWGFAEPRETIHITIDGNDVGTTKADKKGNWIMELEPQPASSGRRIEFAASSGQTAVLNNVAFGDVYLCGGQSNMELCVDAVQNSTAEIEDSKNYPDLRLFTVRGSARDEPQKDVMSKYVNKAWAVSGPSAFVRKDRFFSVFSATCYFFGRDLYKKLNGAVPIGLVASTWSNVPIQVFSSPDSLADATCGGTVKEARTSIFPIRPKNNLQAVSSVPRNEAIPTPTGAQAQKQIEPTDAQTLDSAVALQETISVHDEADHSKDVADTSQISWLSLAKKNDTADNDQVSWLSGLIHPMPPSFLEVSSDGDLEPPRTSQVWNGMYSPLLNLRLSGIIWYQGESNSHEPGVYACLFPALIADWRRKFELPNLEVTFVQVSTGYLPFPGNMIPPEIRDAQLSGLRLNGTAVVPSYDLGEPHLKRTPPFGSMHPRKKQEVGRRLALAVQKLHYGLDVVATGPVVRGFEYNSQSGDMSMIFDPATAEGLHFHAIPECKICCKTSPFEVQTGEGKWLPTEGHEVEGSQVRLRVHKKYAQPGLNVVAVRYAHVKQPGCGLYNGQGGANDHQGIIALPFMEPVR